MKRIVSQRSRPGAKPTSGAATAPRSWVRSRAASSGPFAATPSSSAISIGRGDVRQVGEPHPVVDREPAVLVARHAHGRRELLVLPHRRLRCAIGPHQAVAAEVPVVRLVAEHAAVRPPLGAVRRALDEPVVPPLPDEAALQPVRVLDRVPVVGERPVAVAHRVRVLAQDQRTVLSSRLGVFDDGADRRVHRAHDVGRVMSAVPVLGDRGS